MKKIAILTSSIIVVALMLAFGSTAFAAVPHGGYSTSNAPDIATPNNVQTDLCLSCHDIHQAEGDYALMREATVTEVCGTCHSLFGETAPIGTTWSEAPIDLGGGDIGGDTGEASVSPTAAYENAGAARVSGHRLGVAIKQDLVHDGNNENPGDDTIPGSNLTLKVMDSVAYDEGDIYDGQSVTMKTSTNGLYCASCHTPHGSVGGVDTDVLTAPGGVANTPKPIDNYNSSGVVTSQAYYGDQLVIDECPGLVETSAACKAIHPKFVKATELISSNPNHANERRLKREETANGASCPAATPQETADGIVTVVGDDGLINNDLCDKFMAVNEPATTYNNWCLTCHNEQWNGSDWEGDPMHGVGSGGNNHPPLCVSCHSSGGGDKGLKDFPHTSGNVKLLSKDHDGICLGCHSGGKLP